MPDTFVSEVESPVHAPPRLTIRVKGPNVGEARVAVSDLVEIMRRTQQVVKRVGQVLYGDASQGRGRKKKDIEDLCQLYLVAWQSGSAIAVLELAEPPRQLNMFGYIGERSLEAFVNGMGEISASAEAPTHPPTGFDLGVLQTCAGLASVLEHGIESISFQGTNGSATAEAQYDTRTRDLVQSLLGQPVDAGSVSKVGRLDVLNGHQGVMGNLWEADGTKWTCHFRPDQVEALPEAWRKTVKLTGRAITEENRTPILEVDSILITDDEADERSEASTSMPFWKSVPIEELAELQGVTPINDLDELAALWPVDDDADQLMSHILAERAERRRLVRAGENAR